ncbi:MAG: hypothetical protein AUI10_09500 [Actinobacteria bacterium 13_2_20CM_2_72_6]|nr:MAG: hypothetical protein AUI10_09500 [Actinobacteria bacterium 13_2_20CM_2_72_6]
MAREIRARIPERRFVLFADDVHHLDATSLTLVSQLVEAGAMFLIGTVRTGEPAAQAVSTLWRDDRLARIDLSELSLLGVEELLSAALGGPVEAGTVADVYSIGRGNVLFVRELVRGAVAAGRLRAEHRVWRLTGELTSTAPLIDLVEARVHAVPARGRRVLDLLALVGSTGPELAGAEPEVLEELERAGLVTVRPDRRRLEIALAHPLYGEVLCALLPRLARRRLLLDHAERVERLGARRRGDLLRIAGWRLDARGTADPELLLRAARLARYGHDFRQVRRLAGAALAERTTVEARMLLGEALYELGSFDEAESVLAAAADDPGIDETDLVPVIATRARNLTWGLLQPDRALAVIRAARERVDHPELIAIEARILVYAGAPRDALAALAPIADATDLRSRVLRAVPQAAALVLAGRPEAALAVARQGFADQSEMADQFAMVHPSTHLVIEAYALTEAGRFAEAAELAERGRELAVHDRSAIGRIWFAYHLGRCALLTGQVRTARRWFAEAVALCRDNDYRWPLRLVLSALALAVAVRGDLPAARRAVDEVVTLADIGFLGAEQQLGVAWTAVAAGDVARGRQVLLAAADEAAASGQLGSEARLRHEVVRLDDPDLVRERLATLAVLCESELVAAYAAHASAAATGAADGLAAVADRFERLGLLLYAAEAAYAAGRAYQRTWQPRRATRLYTQAAALAARCEGARTPGLVAGAGTRPLTRREREVAALAARGGSSRDIALQLHLSTRTVDNHLQNAFSKLGVTRRTDLEKALTDQLP